VREQLAELKNGLRGWAVLACIVLGPPFFLLGFRAYWISRGSGSWPTAPGLIISSETAESGRVDDRGIYLRIEYEYRVANRRFVSNQIWVQTNTGPRHSYPVEGQSPQTLSVSGKVRPRDYPVGREVTVYYDPDNPRMALLRPGVSGSAWFMLLVGGAMSVVGVGVVLRAWLEGR
jgi:hypothetical protein